MANQSGVHVIPKEDNSSSTPLRIRSSHFRSSAELQEASSEEILDVFLEAGRCLQDVGSLVVRKEAVDLNRILTKKVRNIGKDEDEVLQQRADRTKRMARMLRTIELAHEELAMEMQLLLDGSEASSVPLMR